ncbi:MAG: putative CRISPR-associated protein [Verrucomicrobiota bacterium]
MPRTIICTAGTTIAKECPTLAIRDLDLLDWDDPILDLDKEIQQRLSGFELSKLAAPTNLSAEINSLLLLKCGGEDEVVLLAADNAVGNLCSRHLAMVIRNVFGLDAAQCKVKRIPQLQMRDVERFKREGLPHLLQEVLGYVRDPQRRYGGGVILNPTGGFKGVVPFMALVGMLYGARVVYGSRATHQLVSLPPLPITHDSRILERAGEAIVWAERQGVFRIEEFFAKIPIACDEETGLFEGLLEVTPDGDATLSPIATVLVEKARDESGRVFISPIASEKLNEMTGPQKSAALAWLLRAGSAEWRGGNGHAFKGSDLEVYGEKRKPIRVAGISHGRDFYVCQFYFQDHNLYDRELCKYQQSNFQYLEEFAPLHSDSFGPEGVTESWGDLLTERMLLKDEIQKLTERANDLSQSLDQAHANLDKNRQGAKAKRKELEKHIANLEQKLKEARMPPQKVDTLVFYQDEPVPADPSSGPP